MITVTMIVSPARKNLSTEIRWDMERLCETLFGTSDGSTKRRDTVTTSVFQAKKGELSVLDVKFYVSVTPQSATVSRRFNEESRLDFIEALNDALKRVFPQLQMNADVSFSVAEKSFTTRAREITTSAFNGRDRQLLDATITSLQPKPKRAAS